MPKASDVLADRLRARILGGELSPGHMLVPERELAEASGLSRNAVREALRILEIEGLVVTRPGRNGGTTVSRPGVDAMARTLDVFIRGRRIRLRDVLEARERIEPICAELAAANRTAEQLAELEAATEAVEAARSNVPAFLTANVVWHQTIAWASGNELLGGFMQALGESVRAATDIEDFNSEAVRDAALHAHRRLLAVIRDRRPERARNLMRAHVHAYREQVLAVDAPDELELKLDRGGT